MEMSHSGLVRLPAKKVGDKTPREFESPHLRSPPHSRTHRVAPAAFGFCARCLLLPPSRGLCSLLGSPGTCESGHFRGSRRDGTVCPTAPLSSRDPQLIPTDAPRCAPDPGRKKNRAPHPFTAPRRRGGRSSPHNPHSSHNPDSPGPGNPGGPHRGCRSRRSVSITVADPDRHRRSILEDHRRPDHARRHQGRDGREPLVRPVVLSGYRVRRLSGHHRG